MKLRQAIFNRVVRRQPRRNVAYPRWKDVSSVFILYESEWTERNPQIRAIVQQLQEKDKQIVAWGWLKKDKIESPILPESRVIGPRDYNLWHKPKAEVLQFLQSHPFDVLIDLTATPVLPMQYIALLCQAKFKIGAVSSPLYDMVVKCDEGANAEYIFQQVNHYLSIIKSAD